MKKICIFILLILTPIIAVQIRAFREKIDIIKIIEKNKKLSIVIKKIDPKSNRVKISLIDTLNCDNAKNINKKTINSADHYVIFYVEGIISYKFTIFCVNDEIIYYKYE